MVAVFKRNQDAEFGKFSNYVRVGLVVGPLDAEFDAATDFLRHPGHGGLARHLGSGR